jgi:hypothetical protein
VRVGFGKAPRGRTGAAKWFAVVTASASSPSMVFDQTGAGVFFALLWTGHTTTNFSALNRQPVACADGGKEKGQSYWSLVLRDARGIGLSQVP